MLLFNIYQVVNYIKREITNENIEIMKYYNIFTYDIIVDENSTYAKFIQNNNLPKHIKKKRQKTTRSEKTH
jgi:hypothetical protein